jgi:DNA-binding response OmpR family regulator
MSSIHILVAEDDNYIREGLVDTLESEGYKVTSAADGQEASDLLEETGFDLVLLDIMMPEKSGYDLCRDIRSKDPDTPIIMLTAKGEEIDKVLGLQLGADDYITKPFGVHELLARISAVLRRSKRAPDDHNANSTMPAEFPFGDATVNTRQFRLVNGSQSIDLTEREVKLLHIFFSHPDEVLGRDMLLNEAWGIDYYGTTRTLDQHIAQLRKKVEADPSKPDFIHTVHGVGYRYCRTE